VQVLGLVALRLLPPLLLVVVVLLALTRERLPPPDGASGAPLQARQDHVGEVLLQPLDVLTGGEEEEEEEEEDEYN